MERCRPSLRQARRSLKGKAPFAHCPTKYTGTVKGGQSVMLKKGDTIAKLAKSTYGYDIYAQQVWEHNAKVLGNQCKQVPSGFGIQLPRIFVPDWLKPPSAKLAAGAQATVVDVAPPPLSFTFPTQKVKSIPIDLGHVILNLTFTVTGSMTVACLSPISQTFSMANYQAQAKAKLGPYASSFNYDVKSKAGSLTLGLASVKAKDLTFSGSMGIVTGGASVSLGVKTISREIGDMQLSGSYSAKAEGRFEPNPKPQPIDAGPIYVTLGGMVILLGGAVLAQIGRAAAAEAAASAGPGLKELLTAGAANAVRAKGFCP